MIHSVICETDKDFGDYGIRYLRKVVIGQLFNHDPAVFFQSSPLAVYPHIGFDDGSFISRNNVCAFDYALWIRDRMCDALGQLVGQLL